MTSGCCIGQYNIELFQLQIILLDAAELHDHSMSFYLKCSLIKMMGK